MLDWIVEYDPRFRPCVLANAPPLTLGEFHAWLEGPVWFPNANELLVNDLANNRILCWTEDTGISVFRHFANGHTRDCQGRLIGCSHHGRCITRTELDGTVTVLPDRFEAKRLNGPNDVVLASDGAIWFSGPHYGGNPDHQAGKHPTELPPYLYRLDPNETLRVAADGVHCIEPSGTLIGKILTGTTVSNLTFGGRNRCRRFICAPHWLMSVYTNVRGAQRP